MSPAGRTPAAHGGLDPRWCWGAGRSGRGGGGPDSGACLSSLPSGGRGAEGPGELPSWGWVFSQRPALLSSPKAETWETSLVRLVPVILSVLLHVFPRLAPRSGPRGRWRRDGCLSGAGCDRAPTPGGRSRSLPCAPARGLSRELHGAFGGLL